MGKYHILHRILIAVLIFCMIFENGAGQVLAAEYAVEPADDVAYSDDSSTGSSNNSSDNGNADSGDNGNSDFGDSSNADSDNNSDDNGNADSGDNSDDNNNAASGDKSNDNSNADSSNNSDNNNNTDSNDNSADNDNPDLDEAEADETDEANEPNEDTEDTPDEDVSEDTANAKKALTAIANAEKAFADILSNKDVMALIYMTDTYHVRSLADKNSSIAADIESGQTVYLLGVTITPDKVWYKVDFWLGGVLTEGYVERAYLAYSDEDWLKWEEEYLYKLAEDGIVNWDAIGGISSYAASYADVEQFPSSYQADLAKLKAAHPNWTFVPMNTKLDFGTAVSAEMGVKSLIQNTTSNAAKGWVGEACPTTAGWYYATRDALSYHMDPRNFLTETYIFQFEQLTFNSSYHTVDAIQSFLNSTFMKGALPDDDKKRTYAQAFYEIGQARKLSPIHLASRVYQEQGQGNSGLISGTYPGYEGYYNYFNVKANGGTTAEVIKNGLAHAKSMGWNTRYKSLEGGAATIGNNYILKSQDTIYLEKFNVASNSPYGLYEHQYMQNIQAPSTEAASSKKMYSGAGSLDSAFVFKIPVYGNMPSSNPLVGISLDKEEVTLRRPDTVVEDTSNLNAEEKEQNRASVTLQVSYIAENPKEDTTDDKTITWTSSNKKVATVQDGVVTAVGAGQATITAKAPNAGNKTAECKVTVIAPVYKIEFSSENNTDTILAGQSINLSAEYFPKDTTSDTTVTWKSSDTSVATVGRTKGSVRGISAGTADITATIGGYSASHRITVEGCTVTFMAADNTTVLKTISASYGEEIPQELFPDMDNISDSTHGSDDSINNTAASVFVGWYTGVDGTGSRFDYGTQIYQRETILYPCFKQQGKGFYVVPIGDQTYTGSAIKPEILVYNSSAYDESQTKPEDTAHDGSQDNPEAAANSDNTPESSRKAPVQLVLNRDYTISYKNNKNAASATSAKPPTITVKGKGNYAGTQTITFNIVTKALTDADITADNITAAYTGKTIKNSPILYRNGKKLIKNTDYKVTYPQTGAGAYRNAGTYPVVITGAGGYHGTLTVYETITPKVLLSKASIAKIPNQAYDPSIIDKKNGIGIEPPLTVTYKQKPLHESEDDGVTGDYVITYKNNFAAGTATATITAVDSEENLYAGSKSITFKITAASINKADINGIEAKTYTGLDEDVKQTNISVATAGNTLTESTDNGKTGDYVLEYKNISKAGTATVIIKGINKYTGAKKKTYKINACDLGKIKPDISISYCTEDKDIANPADITAVSSLEDITTPYVKGGAKPTLLLSYKGRELVAGKDYTVKYKNNNAVTTANIPKDKLPMVTITGKGLFKGKISGTFRITDGAMSDNTAKITMTAKDVIYKDKKGAYKTSVALIDVSGKKLQAGRDYDKTLHYTYVNETSLTNTQGANITRNAGEEVKETDIPSIGTAIRITVKGMGAYAGGGETAATKSAIYHIAAADISKAKVTITAKAYNDGKEIILTKDDITVTLNGKKLVFGEDYEILSDTYVGNYTKGKASVTIKGTGAGYGGIKKVSFTIVGKKIEYSL